MGNIDLTKCNNLRYKAKIDGNDDYGRICVENADTGHAFLRSDKEDESVGVWHCDDPAIQGISERTVTDFELVPRDPETYRDWQVGDRATVPNEKWNDSAYKEIIFRSGELVICKDGNGDISGGYTCGQLHRLGYRLALTGIEQQIIEEEKQLLFDAMAKEGKRWNAEKKVVEDIPKTYEFKKGEPVLVRDSLIYNWQISVFLSSLNKEFVTQTGKEPASYKYCIPYNERTMHLLGTAEDYKEGE